MPSLIIILVLGPRLILFRLWRILSRHLERRDLLRTMAVLVGRLRVVDWVGCNVPLSTIAIIFILKYHVILPRIHYRQPLLRVKVRIDLLDVHRPQLLVSLGTFIEVQLLLRIVAAVLPRAFLLNGFLVKALVTFVIRH